MISLSDDNYYTVEADKEYLSNSQIKRFQKCEYEAMKYLNGEMADTPTQAMLVGQYVDEALTGTKESFDKWCESHPEIFSSRGATKGLLKSDFQKAQQMVDIAKADEGFIKWLKGKHQVIMTGSLFGVPIKIKMDSYFPGKAIVDLKTTESLSKSFWNADLKQHESFIEHFNYVQQMAIYQEIVYQNTGEKLPCILACISKETVPDHDLFFIDNEVMHECIYGNEFVEGLANTITRIQALKDGEAEPIKCGHCESCLKDKKVDKPKHYLEILGDLS